MTTITLSVTPTSNGYQATISFPDGVSMGSAETFPTLSDDLRSYDRDRVKTAQHARPAKGAGSRTEAQADPPVRIPSGLRDFGTQKFVLLAPRDMSTNHWQVRGEAIAFQRSLKLPTQSVSSSTSGLGRVDIHLYCPHDLGRPRLSKI
jgi:hypothetical protein